MEFAGAIEHLESQIAIQRDMSSKFQEFHPVVNEAIEVETHFVLWLRRRIWKWDEASKIPGELETYQRVFDRFTGVMREAAVTEDPNAQNLMDMARLIFRKGVVEASTLMDKMDETKGAAEASTLTEPEGVRPQPASKLASTFFMVDPTSGANTGGSRSHFPPRRGLVLWLLDNAWWITLLVIAAVIIFVGYQTEFIDNTAFEGDASDYVQLIAWALAIQVAGGTIIETVGRLRTSRAAG